MSRRVAALASSLLRLVCIAPCPLLSHFSSLLSIPSPVMLSSAVPTLNFTLDTELHSSGRGRRDKGLSGHLEGVIGRKVNVQEVDTA